MDLKNNEQQSWCQQSSFEELHDGEAQHLKSRDYYADLYSSAVPKNVLTLGIISLAVGVISILVNLFSISSESPTIVAFVFSILSCLVGFFLGLFGRIKGGNYINGSIDLPVPVRVGYALAKAGFIVNIVSAGLNLLLLAFNAIK